MFICSTNDVLDGNARQILSITEDHLVREYAHNLDAVLINVLMFKDITKVLHA
jgi:hypothetical protein